jgi:hypothetical protein
MADTEVAVVGMNAGACTASGTSGDDLPDPTM